MPGPSEADARIRIDALLAQAGWDLTDKTQVLTEVTHDLPLTNDVVDLSVPAILTDDPPDGRGRADYVLLDRRGRPLSVVEATCEGQERTIRRHFEDAFGSSSIQCKFSFYSESDLPHERFLCCHERGLALNIGRGFDLFDRQGMIRDIHLNLADHRPWLVL